MAEGCCRGLDSKCRRAGGHHLRGRYIRYMDLGDHIKKIWSAFKADRLGFINCRDLVYRKAGLEQTSEGVEEIARPVSQV